MLNDFERMGLSNEQDTNQRIPDTSIVQDSSQSRTSSELSKIDSSSDLNSLSSGLSQAFVMFSKAELKSSEAGIDRATGGYLSATALLKAQNNITNIYGKASEQMTTAKQSGILFDVARFAEKDAQFSGDIASMEALSVGKFKARSKEIQANAMKGMAIANALSSINQYIG